MKITSGYDDEIQFTGFGFASPITEYSKPKKQKRAKFKVGFAIPKKIKGSSVAGAEVAASSGVKSDSQGGH